MMRQKLDQTKLRKSLRHNNFHNVLGKIEQIVGMTVEATGMSCNIGDVCTISGVGKERKRIQSEVVGFKNNKVLLMPYGDIDGIGYGSFVSNTGEKLKIKMSEALIGRTIDALGNPIDNQGEIKSDVYYSINGSPANPMRRPPIVEPLEFGVKAIDGMITIGKGQRMGIFAGSGVGKSTLMGMIARNIKADVNVIALVGERGRELMEFIKQQAQTPGLKISEVLETVVKKPIAARIIKDAGLDPEAESMTLQPVQMVQIANLLRRFILTPCGKKGWKEAQVTKGGVSLEEINLGTMESKLVEGLYFAGEVIDYDGPCGGYNLHNAWLTGMKAGKDMANRV